MLHIIRDTRRFGALPKLNRLMFIHIFEIHWFSQWWMGFKEKFHGSIAQRLYIDEDSMPWAQGPLDFCRSALIFGQHELHAPPLTLCPDQGLH